MGNKLSNLTTEKIPLKSFAFEHEPEISVEDITLENVGLLPMLQDLDRAGQERLMYDLFLLSVGATEVEAMNPVQEELIGKIAAIAEQSEMMPRRVVLFLLKDYYSQFPTREFQMISTYFANYTVPQDFNRGFKEKSNPIEDGFIDQPRTHAEVIPALWWIKKKFEGILKVDPLAMQIWDGVLLDLGLYSPEQDPYQARLSDKQLMLLLGCVAYLTLRRNNAIGIFADPYKSMRQL